jgi:glutamate synthase (NADPH/NADH) small chain
MFQEIRKRKAAERIRDFNEVCLGFTDMQAHKEAGRCLQCRRPLCVKGCPVNIDIPSFIKLLLQKKQRQALQKIKEKNSLPAICGRVCPQENQCAKACILNKKGAAINIAALERYAADYELVHARKFIVPRKKLPTANYQLRTKIAVVGSGPAGLTSAAELAKMGYFVNLFESLHIPGGVLSYGIPEFRLPKKIVAREVEYIKSLGVDIITDCLIGRTFSLGGLFKQGFKAIFLATGAGLPQFLGIHGENLNSIYSANEFLTRINLMKAYRFPKYATPLNLGKDVAIIGAGNVAFDCARAAMRLGKKVTLIYRRAEAQMPARSQEIKNAREEGLQFSLLTQPVKFLADDNGALRTIECVKTRLGRPDNTGRKRPLPVEGSNFFIEAQTAIVAVGQRPNPLMSQMTPGLKTNPDTTLWVDDKFMTSIAGVFAGGDIITGADTVISAMKAGKRAAVEIDRYIKSK